jgi:selenide,water dikinase
LPANDDPRILVDFRTGDDAGVLRLDEERALVQTIDFLTPIVDDPWTFGAIAAANALSDVYAMGAQPLSALAVAALPERDFPHDWAAAIFRGGFEKLREAGCLLLGGHTVRDPEIKFGYAVTGLVDPRRVLTNAGARPGDELYLTKPIGTGILSTAQKQGRAPREAIQEAERWMLRLNRIPPEIRDLLSAATDVTGFGLAGHALGLARESAVALRLEAAAIPILKGAGELALECAPGGLASNRAAHQPAVSFEGEVAEPLRTLLFDPQTSGGLLFTAAPGHEERIRTALPGARRIGAAQPPAAIPLTVRA